MKYFFSLLFFFLLCCGGSGSQNDTSTGDVIFQDLPEPADFSQSLVSKQESLTNEEFIAETDSDSDLKSTVEKCASDGFSEFQEAGSIEDQDGNKVTWARFTNTEGAAKDAVRFCDTVSCSYIVQEISGEEAVWSDRDGNQVSVKKLANPCLLKHLKGHDWAKDKTEVVLPLESDGEPDKTVNLKERRFIIANAFGNTWNLDLDSIKSVVEKSEIFSGVEQNDFVTAQEIEEYMTLSHPYEIILIAAQGLREVVKKTSADSYLFRSFGFTTASSAYGEHRFTVDDFENAAAKRILGGAGMIFVLASDTIKELPVEFKSVKNLLNSYNDYPQAVLGFDGHGPTKLLVKATEFFFDKYLNGTSIEESIAYVNAWLAKCSSPVKLKSNQSPVSKGKIVIMDQFWNQKKPSSGEFNSFISFTRKCTPKTGSSSEDQKQANLWIKGVTFSGPMFSGSYEKEGSKPGDKLTMKMDGIFISVAKDIHFYFTAEGDINSDVRDIKIYGDAVILSIKEDKDKTTITFDGKAGTTDYVNEAGEPCTLKNVSLGPMIQGEGESKFYIMF
jgi:hypothetical protein